MLEAFERRNFLKEETLSSIEEKVNMAILKLTDKAISKIQNEYKKDVIGLGSHLHAYHPTFWEGVEEEWDQGSNNFAKSEIKVVPHVTIRRIGAVNNTEERQGGR